MKAVFREIDTFAFVSHTTQAFVFIFLINLINFVSKQVSGHVMTTEQQLKQKVVNQEYKQYGHPKKLDRNKKAFQQMLQD
jgi:hypothetical protein